MIEYPAVGPDRPANNQTGATQSEAQLTSRPASSAASDVKQASTISARGEDSHGAAERLARETTRAPSEQARGGTGLPAAATAVAAHLLSDGRAYSDGGGLSSDLNCRHPIRSAHTNHCCPEEAAAAAAVSSTSRQDKEGSDGAPDTSGGDSSCLFKQQTTKFVAPFLLTYRELVATNNEGNGGGAKVTTSLLAARNKPAAIKQLPPVAGNFLQRRLGKTIKSLVATTANWSRSNEPPAQSSCSKPINVQQTTNSAHQDDDDDDEQQQRQTSCDKLANAIAQQDAVGSDTTDQPFKSHPYTDNGAIKKLRNSLSCELTSSSSLCHTSRRRRLEEEQLLDNDDDYDQQESNNHKQQQQQRRNRRRRRSSSLLKINHSRSSTLESIADADTSNNMSSPAGRGRHEVGANLAQNRYILEDLRAQHNRKSARLLQRQSGAAAAAAEEEEAAAAADSRRTFCADDRRSTVCSSTCNHDDDTCSLSLTNNNNNNPDNDGNRQGNSNDCKNPSSRSSQIRAVGGDSLVNLADIQQFQSEAPPGKGGRKNRWPSKRRNSPKRHQQQAGEQVKRENWGMNIEFLLAVIGFAVDLGNIWRFPYICYRNGGGAFLIPYTVLFILGGLPIFYLEMSLGQYSSSGCLTVWSGVCPAAKGIGYAMCMLNFYTGLYYNTIISWAVFFFVESFTMGDLPWISCDNPWNTLGCKTIGQRQALRAESSNLTTLLLNVTTSLASNNYSSPTKDYFEREVLKKHMSRGIDDLGSIRLPLAAYLAIVFVCIYFAIWKGVRSTGKAVWITALLPYFVLIPLLIRGVFLEGAWLGIRYYLEPQWEKVYDVDVWVEAAKQIYFSLGPGFGTLLALSSYNKFHHNVRRDAFIAASVNYFASFIAGLVVFALLGYMATIMDVSISDVATEGPGLVFQVYPEGLATMQFSSLWSVLFFIMVITLGIDSTFGGLESVITGLCDEYPRVLRKHRGIFIGFLIVLIYLCSLPTTTYGGNYVIYLLESYGTSLSLIFIVLVETIVVCWIYGTDRFCGNLEEMYGERPGLFWRICWKYISPTILLLIFFAACLQELNKYDILSDGDYVYPSWAPTLGLLMTGSSICCIPIYAIYYMKTKTSGTLWEA